jgi:Fur family ferric uptake transcriptional regulator
MDTDAILSDLREQGVRVTTVRRAVITVLAADHSHQSADDLAAAVQADHPDVHRSTIYRTLDSLEKLGIVGHTHVGHGPAVYHAGVTHQHLVCEECGAVIDVPAELLQGLRITLHAQYGFELHIGHFALLGRCALHPHVQTVRISP